MSRLRERVDTREVRSFCCRPRLNVVGFGARLSRRSEDCGRRGAGAALGPVLLERLPPRERSFVCVSVDGRRALGIPLENVRPRSAEPPTRNGAGAVFI